MPTWQCHRMLVITVAMEPNGEVCGFRKFIVNRTIQSNYNIIADSY